MSQGAVDTMSEHEHSWTSDGVGFTHTHQLPGSGARRRLYYDVYVCTGCLKRRALALPVVSDSDNSYVEVKYGARPLGADVVIA
jgi:hypothetical protein